jgi:hypothetical protein
LICSGCGHEAPTLKSCRWRKGGKRVFALCDPCYAPLSASLWIVPAPFTITSRCDCCHRYVRPDELDPATSRPGGHSKRDLHSSGLCVRCSREAR